MRTSGSNDTCIHCHKPLISHIESASVADEEDEVGFSLRILFFMLLLSLRLEISHYPLTRSTIMCQCTALSIQRVGFKGNQERSKTYTGGGVHDTLYNCCRTKIATEYGQRHWRQGGLMVFWHADCSDQAVCRCMFQAHMAAAAHPGCIGLCNEFNT